MEKRGALGLITLNRPNALNAVTASMVSAIDDILTEWEADDDVEAIAIRAVEGRAFSAGGDIRHLYDCGIRGEFDFDFFAHEYRLNARIGDLGKPYIALINGIVMGGGVGVSFHGSHRIVGPDVTFAMPEVGIGFFPDVGGSHLLSRLPGSTGQYLGLTGTRIGQADCLATGLATHAIEANAIDPMIERLAEAESIENILPEFAIDPEGGTLAAQQAWIDEAFSGKDLRDIFLACDVMQSAEGERAGWAERTLANLKDKAPLSLSVAHEQINRGNGQSLRDCMAMEYRILRRILPRSDFYEGIRTAIIDKGEKPVWSPASIDRVSKSDIEAIFAPLGDEELFS